MTFALKLHLYHLHIIQLQNHIDVIIIRENYCFIPLKSNITLKKKKVFISIF